MCSLLEQRVWYPEGSRASVQWPRMATGKLVPRATRDGDRGEVPGGGKVLEK